MSTATATACPEWCTDHAWSDDGDPGCHSHATRVGGMVVAVGEGGRDERPGALGISVWPVPGSDEEVTPVEARALAAALLHAADLQERATAH